MNRPKVRPPATMIGAARRPESWIAAWAPEVWVDEGAALLEDGELLDEVKDADSEVVAAAI